MSDLEAEVKRLQGMYMRAMTSINDMNRVIERARDNQ